MSDVTVSLPMHLRAEWVLLLESADPLTQAERDSLAALLRAAKPVIDDPQGLTDAYMLGHYDGKKDAKTTGEWQPWDGSEISLSEYEIHICYRRRPEETDDE